MVQNESVLLSTDLSLQIDVLYRMYAITCIQDASLSFTCNRKKKCKEAHQSMSHWKCLLSCSTGRLILTAWNSLPGKKKVQITGKHSSGIICLASYKKLSSNLCSCFQPAVYYHAGLTHTHRNTQKQTQILSQQKDYIPIMSQLPPKQTNTNLLLAVVPQGVLYLVLYLSNYKYD